MGGWFLAEARRVLRLAAPVAAAYLLNKTTSLVSLKFAGELGTDELAAASLAQTLWNVTGISLLVGMSIGMQTVIAQAFGSKDFHAVGVTVHRAAFLFVLLLVPLSALHCTMGPVLRGVGIPPVIAAHAAAYILRLVPGLWAYGGITVRPTGPSIPGRDSPPFPPFAAGTDARSSASASSPASGTPRTRCWSAGASRSGFPRRALGRGAGGGCSTWASLTPAFTRAGWTASRTPRALRRSPCWHCCA